MEHLPGYCQLKLKVNYHSEISNGYYAINKNYSISKKIILRLQK